MDIYALHVAAPSALGYVILAVALLLLVCSGLVSASENAFFSLSPSDVADIKQGRQRGDATVWTLLEQSERLLATILIANNLVNVAIITLLDYFVMYGGTGGQAVLDFGGSKILEFLLLTVVLTFLLLLFGEVMPKIYSNTHALSFSRRMAPVFRVLAMVFHPLATLLIGSKQITKHIVPHETQALTVDDLEQALELTDKKELEEESSMLKGIIRFGGETVRDVMTPRVDLVDLDVHTTYPDVLKCIVENNYSRIPVYTGTEDKILGVLYIKDLLPHLGKPASFRWQSLIRPPYFVPETKMIDDLLADFQANKVHIAIVVDEFGGTSGIVTMEDILEEIVGEINDEYDDEELPYTRLNQNTYIFEAKTLLSDFAKIFQLPDDYFEPVEGEADTLAGLLLEIKGDFPRQDEKIQYRRFTFIATETDQRRIVKIKVVSSTKNEKSATAK